MMGAGPVDPSAVRATAEIVVVLASQRLQAIDDLFLGNRDQAAVAPHAARQGRQPLPQVQSPYHFEQLFLGLLGVHEQAMGDRTTLQQPAVAGEQDPLLGQADVDQRRVVGHAGPPNIESE